MTLRPVRARGPPPTLEGRRTRPRRLVRESNPSHSIDSGAATPVASRGTSCRRSRSSPRQESNLRSPGLEDRRLSARPRGRGRRRPTRSPRRTRPSVDPAASSAGVEPASNRLRRPAPLRSATRTKARPRARAREGEPRDRGSVRGSHPPPLSHNQPSSLDEQRYHDIVCIMHSLSTACRAILGPTSMWRHSRSESNRYLPLERRRS